MRQNRFYLEREFNDSVLELTDQAIVSQLKNVLRLKEGDFFSLFNGQGVEIKVKISNFKARSIEVFVVSREEKVETTPKVCLYLAIPQ